MKSKESPTGLEKNSLEELYEGMDKADKTGYWKGAAQGIIHQELTRRARREQNPPARSKKAKPVKEGKIYSPIDDSWGMRGIGKNRGNR